MAYIVTYYCVCYYYVCLQVFLCVLDKSLCKLEQEESMEETLEQVNENIESLSLLTDFPIGACLHLPFGYGSFQCVQTLCACMPFIQVNLRNCIILFL